MFANHQIFSLLYFVELTLITDRLTHWFTDLMALCRHYVRLNRLSSNCGRCRESEAWGTGLPVYIRHHGLYRCRRQRPHERDELGKLQPYPCRGPADCRWRVAAHTVRPWTAIPLAEQIEISKTKRKIRNTTRYSRLYYGFFFFITRISDSDWLKSLPFLRYL